MRVVRGEIEGYDVLLTPDQAAHAKALNGALQSSSQENRDGLEPRLGECEWSLLVQNLVFSLFAHKRQPKQHSRWFSPINCFIVLYSVTKTGDFERANEITQTLAHLAWCGRSALLLHILAQEQDEGVPEDQRDIHK